MAEKQIEGFTRHKSGGWVRRHNGKTIWCGNAASTRAEVMATYERKCEEMEAAAPAGDPLTYRDLLAAFLTAMEGRVKTGFPRPLSARTLHNYVVALNDFGRFIDGGTLIAEANRPAVFARYAAKFGGWKASGYDSVITRVSALFRWAEDMEYIDRFRPGPGFARPAKSLIRHERIDLAKCFTPDEIGKLWQTANHVTRCWIGLGLFCGMNNSEVAHLTESVLDLDRGVIDFTRRKVGKIRRVCPLPDVLAGLLRTYMRPAPLDDADGDLLFITRHGASYGGTRRRDGKPSDSISRLFRDLMEDAGVKHRRGRNFSGLRTTFYNLAPGGEWELDRAIIFGRAKGTVDLDSYLEGVHLNRLRHVVSVIYDQVSSPLRDVDASFPAVAFAPELSPAT